MIQKGAEFNELPENIVIFICENDILGKGLPLYHIRRTLEETGEPFDDGALIIYVNGEYRGNDPLGRLMHDFFCEKPEDMYYKELADRMKSVKNNERGVNKMCKIMEDIVNEENMARVMRALSLKKLSVDEIADIFDISVDKVTEIGRSHALI